VLHGDAHWRHLANTIEPFMFSGPTKMDEPVKNPFGVWTWVGATDLPSLPHLAGDLVNSPCSVALQK